MAENPTLLIDGVKYCLWTPKNEEELENSVKFHSEKIFGSKSIYFDVKKKIKTITGEGTIPDAYLINFEEETFYVIEIELSTHHEYDHIGKQIGKFIGALKDYRTRQKIARILKDYIDEDIIRQKFVLDKIGNRELYQFFLEDILENVKEQKFHTIIVIDEITEKVSEACSILMQNPKILEFKTFIRENVGDLRVHCHLFESLAPEKTIKKPLIVTGEFITRHRNWGIKDDNFIYVAKVNLKRDKEYRDTLKKEEFVKIIKAIHSLAKKGKILTRKLITEDVYGKNAQNNRYWWVDNSMGILLLEGSLAYLGGKFPQKFKLTENFIPEKILKKI